MLESNGQLGLWVLRARLTPVLASLPEFMDFIKTTFWEDHMCVASNKFGLFLASPEVRPRVSSDSDSAWPEVFLQECGALGALLSRASWLMGVMLVYGEVPWKCGESILPESMNPGTLNNT